MHETNPKGVGSLCECCGSNSADLDLVSSKFEYKHGQKVVPIEVQLPVYSCSECGFEYTSEESEVIKHIAICKYLNLLEPSQIVSLRKKHNFSISKLSSISGIGTASISRWEAGSLHQSKANDNYLRLLMVDENISLLTSGININVQTKRQPSLCYVVVHPQLLEKAKNFHL
jgi:putative zinc finger/helix-turn-helix YgiT family protein